MTGCYRGFTLGVLFKATTLADVHSILTVDPAHETNGLDVRVDRLGNLGVFAGNFAAVVAKSCVAPERWTLLVLRVRNGREVRVWVDYTRVVIGGALRGVCPAFGEWQGVHVAQGTPSTHAFHGEVAELVVFGSALDDALVEQLHSYFIAKLA